MPTPGSLLPPCVVWPPEVENALLSRPGIQFVEVTKVTFPNGVDYIVTFGIMKDYPALALNTA
jgi:hypothetical protein